jgi:broad specificity phosphatase PhoE
VGQDVEAAGRLILVRHGESEGNRDRTFTQTPDAPLTLVGRDQARRTALRIAQHYRPARIIASPFARAWQTAKILASVLGRDVQAEPGLREQSFGVLAGQPYDALLTDASYSSHEGSRWQWRPPGGESLADVYERVVPVFERLRCVGAREDMAVVSHGGVMLALCAYVTGTWDGLTVTPNAGIVVVEHCGATYRLLQPIPEG